MFYYICIMKTINITDGLHKEMKYFSLVNNISLSDMAQNAIKQFMENEPQETIQKTKESQINESLGKLYDTISNETGESKELIVHRVLLEFAQNYFKSKK